MGKNADLKGPLREAGSRKLLAAALVVTALAAACQSEPRARGEALVVIATDVAVPARIDRVRVDVYDEDMALLDSRELPTLYAPDWPLSFSVMATSPDAAHTAWLRIRGFRGGARSLSSSAASESPGRPWSEPSVPATIADACAAAPELRPGESVTLRRGDTPLTAVVGYVAQTGRTTCNRPTLSGSVAARVVIADRDRYVLEVASSSPDPTRDGPGGDATLALRTDCLVGTAQLACDDKAAGGSLPRLELDLDPGTYWLVSGGGESAFADLTLRVSRRNEFVAVDPPAPAPPGAASEPAPETTIDRLVAVHLEPDRRGTYEVALHGECFGAAVDMSAKRSCVSAAGVLEPVTPGEVGASLTRLATTAVATWPADTPSPCTTPPRPGSALRDGETCVPGGAFVLGDSLALSDGDFRAQPQRVRALDPFLVDTFEVSVGRYRDALRRGFSPPRPPDPARPDPIPNAGMLTVDNACTWSVGPSANEPAPGIDREAFPLNCVSWDLARALCRFWGGDLPSEDQWEYAATAAGRAHETSYPWGDEPPDCDRAVIGRHAPFGVAADDACTSRFGPTAVDDASWAHPGADVSPIGIVGLAGNVSEWTSSGFLPYAHPAWQEAGLRAPLLVQEHAPMRALRGGSWASEVLPATGSARLASPPVASWDIGFRCVRRGR